MPDLPTTPLARYVVLRHEGILEPHFDLMIEPNSQAQLWTWRCAAWPLTVGAVLERLPDHRREFLDYEGPLSGGRGTVRRVEAGTQAAVLWTSHPPSLRIEFRGARNQRVELENEWVDQRDTGRWRVINLSA
jgi:hypothetical protein